MTVPGETGAEQVAYLREMTCRIAGFDLEKEQSLISAPRVMDLLAREKMGTLGELVARLRQFPEGPLHHNVVESLAVSDTSFFRDNRVFEMLEKNVLPSLIEKRAKERSLTLWSAGCSTGQEAYSLGILALECLGSRSDWTWRVVGSDLSSRNIRVAETGAYSQFDINCGLPAPKLVAHFEKRNDHWCVQENLRKHVTFQKLNLADPNSAGPSADLILLRNVLRYLNPTRRYDVLTKVRSALAPDGILVVGEGESVLKEDGFESVRIGPGVVFRPLAGTTQ